MLFVMRNALFTETQSTILKILKTFGALFVVLRPPNVPNYQIIQPLTIRTIMIIMILLTFLMRTSSISLPLFNKTTFLIHPTGTVQQIMLIPSCYLEYPAVFLLSLKFLSELASSNYLPARLLGWTNLVVIF